jgi:TPR repeat protein
VARLLISAFLLAFVTLPAAASADPFDDGVSAFERGDYATALRIWRPLAEHDPRAATNLGVMYAEGLGVQKDAVEALRWLGPAALAGEPNAQMHLGVMFAEGTGGRPPDYEAAAAWYRAAAEQGYPHAQVLLAFAYSVGEGVPEDYVAAHMWVNLAAAKLPPGKARDAALQLRDQLADKMTPAQITDAQKLAGEWTPKAAAPPPAKP